MIELSYNNSDYKGLLNLLARSFNLQVNEHSLLLTEPLGKGFLTAFNLPGGLSVLISDTIFNSGIMMYRTALASQPSFILQFNQSSELDKELNYNSSGEQHVYNLGKQAILLTSSLTNSKFIFPPKAHIRSVRIMFSYDFLCEFSGKELADKFLTNYFSIQLKNINPEPIGTDYRVIMDELIKERIDHPFRQKFVHNRALQLIEKLITGFIDKVENNNQFIKLKDDEVNRLMKVEAMLIKDFSGVPAIIATLSKVAAMSPTKLKRDFKAMYGLPIYEYYQKNRMLRAKALLMEGKYAIKEVGIMVGYTNLGHFAGSFKKEFGVLPSEITIDHHLADDEDVIVTRIRKN